MSCLAFLEKMSRCLDGDLSGREFGILQEHLRYCENCRKLWSVFQDLDQAFSIVDPVNPSTDFALNLNRRLTEHSAEQYSHVGASRIKAFLLMGFSLAVLSAFSILFEPIFEMLSSWSTVGLFVNGLTLALEFADLLGRLIPNLWADLDSTEGLVFVAGFSLMGLILTIIWTRLITYLANPREGELFDGLS